MPTSPHLVNFYPTGGHYHYYLDIYPHYFFLSECHHQYGLNAAHGQPTGEEKAGFSGYTWFLEEETITSQNSDGFLRLVLFVIGFVW